MTVQFLQNHFDPRNENKQIGDDSNIRVALFVIGASLLKASIDLKEIPVIPICTGITGAGMLASCYTQKDGYAYLGAALSALYFQVSTLMLLCKMAKILTFFTFLPAAKCSGVPFDNYWNTFFEERGA